MNNEDKKIKITMLLENKKWLSNYEAIKEFECSIMLEWHEVKSIRDKHFHLKSSFVTIRDWDLYLQKMHITPYKMLPPWIRIDPERERKLFLKKREITLIEAKIKEKGLTIIPTAIYLKWNLIKARVAIAKWLKQYEKKEKIKNRDIESDLRRSLSERV